ncbi:unnamed protein product [Paramecium octaurelia]|uniref:Uncharacterized protein n=1 Tax=Paramecium octaurelia TaxID=43137 RepID=A0A8S1WEY1_PAROT|nr:unnamed protein product [Paramecium octaurelia]
MGKSHLKIYIVLLISHLCSIAIGQTFVKLQDTCACEELLEENECRAATICNYSHRECKTIQCTHLSAKDCVYNSNCALVNNTCADFESCASHNATTLDDCVNLFHNCYFDNNKMTCRDPQKIDLGRCSETINGRCLIANEGLCAWKNGVCQELTACEDVDPTSLQSCEFEDDKCVSHLQCSQLEMADCKFAKEKINGDRYQLCMIGRKGCINFDPTQQTKDTCWKNSNAFYHWVGKNCLRCSWASIMKSVLFVALLILSI